MTRRGVLTGAAAIAGATALPRFLNPAAGAVAATAPAGRTAIGHVVVDERLAHSAAFAGGFDGPRIHAVSALDDLCNRWYSQLRKLVLADALDIAGLTSWMDYLVMRGCAREIGYASAFHAEHLPGATGFEHRVSAYPDLPARLTGLRDPQSWAQALGEALASGAQLRSRFVPGQVFSAITAAASPGHVRMVSWVFSPRI